MGIATPVSWEWNGNGNVVMGMGGNENSPFSHSRWQLTIKDLRMMTTEHGLLILHCNFS